MNSGLDPSRPDSEPIEGEHEFSPNRLEEDASVRYGSALRGDLAPIHVGRGTHIQDLTAVHVDGSRTYIAAVGPGPDKEDGSA